MHRVLVLLITASIAICTPMCNNITSCDSCTKTVDEKGVQLCSWCLPSGRCVSRLSFECLLHRTSTDSSCPIYPPNDSWYDDELARWTMLPLSAAAYSNNPQQCLNNALNGAQLKRQITVICDRHRSQTCSAFTAYSDRLRANFLAFRGTEDFVQLMTEGEHSILDPQVTVDGMGKVNEYFYNAFQSVWNGGIREDLEELILRNPSYELWITGHSLGGAMASIASAIIAKNRLIDAERMKLITFGQPRTGDSQYASAHDQLLNYTYRVVHSRDVVVHIPPRDFENYHHHLYEVWYFNAMDEGDLYEVCMEQEDHRCSNSLVVHLSVKQHTHYFGKSVKHFGKRGCPNTVPNHRLISNRLSTF